MAQAHYLIPEQTLYDRVSSAEAQSNSSSKNYPTRNNKTLNVEEDSENQQYEENYVNKVCLFNTIQLIKNYDMNSTTVNFIP